jgi:hypothetical protein
MARNMIGGSRDPEFSIKPAGQRSGSLGNMANAMKIRPVSVIEVQLEAIGAELAAAREVLAYHTEVAKAAALDAAELGVSERSIAAALGVARSRTLRRWIGK